MGIINRTFLVGGGEVITNYFINVMKCIILDRCKVLAKFP